MDFCLLTYEVTYRMHLPAGCRARVGLGSGAQQLQSRVIVEAFRGGRNGVEVRAQSLAQQRLSFASSSAPASLSLPASSRAKSRQADSSCFGSRATGGGADSAGRKVPKVWTTDCTEAGVEQDRLTDLESR
jgi:hypothetical protein